MTNRLLVTGGAGFVGSNLAVGLAGRHPDWDVLALDNLYRRGSELNLPRLERAGVEFVRGDVRDRSVLTALPTIDTIVECSAEPSVVSGVDGDAAYMVQTNLMGAFNCLELAKRDGAGMVFLSTSRVYPVGALSSVGYEETATRFELAAEQAIPGVSSVGISEAFPIQGMRTLYGATKLAAELLIEEYRETFGIDAVVNRCGVIAGPWQMGKVDQGVFTFWLLSHHFEQPLSYIGYGGGGRQVRDLLHVKDLLDLVEEQLLDPERWTGLTVNVGGGLGRSLSLVEATGICVELTGKEVPIAAVADTREGDVPIYVSDCSLLFGHTSWRPQLSPQEVLRDIHEWVVVNQDALHEALGIGSSA